MRNMLWIFFSLFVLSGCAYSYNYSPTFTSKWIGQPIESFEETMYYKGIFKTDENGGKFYLWPIFFQGKNKAMNTCELRMYVDTQNRITKIVNYTNNYRLKCPVDFRRWLNKENWIKAKAAEK